MDNMDKKQEKQEKKEKKPKMQVIISSMMLILIIFMEMYLMIHLQSSYLEIILLVGIALVMVHFLINGIVDLLAENEAKREQQYENIVRAEKALYLLLKKNFAEMEEPLDILQEEQELAVQEVINAHKGISKAMMNFHQENNDALMKLTEEVLERLYMTEEKQDEFTELLEEQKAKLAAVDSQIEVRLQGLLSQLKEQKLSLDSVAAAPAEIQPEQKQAEEVVEAVEEEEVKPPMPDMSDPNKMMSPDDIAALLANL